MVKHYTIPEYQRRTGASRAAIEKMMAEGVFRFTKSEGGKVTYLIIEENEELNDLRNEISDLKKMVSTLMAHLGARGTNENPRASR